VVWVIVCGPYYGRRGRSYSFVWFDNILYCRSQELRSLRALDCGRLVTVIAGLNPSDGMDVCFLCLYVVLFCVGRDLCDGLCDWTFEAKAAINNI
jgi:hypothetical protein